MQQTIEKLLESATKAQNAEQFNVAHKFYRDLFKLGADHPEANYCAGELAVAIGKPEDSLAFYETALRQKPKTLIYWISYIGALSQLGMINRAKQMLAEAKTIGLDENALFTLQKLLVETVKALKTKTNILDEISLSKALASAERMAQKGEAKKAIRVYKDILEKHPNNKRALTNYQKLAPAEMSRAAMIPREPPEHLIEHIQAWLKDSHLHALLKLTSTLTRDYPASIALNTAEGAARRGLLQYEQAIECFRKVLAVKPDSANTHFNIGVCHMEMQDREAAEECFKTAVDYEETLTEIYRHWAVIRKFTPEDEILFRMESLYKNKDLTAGQRCSLCFALAKAYEDLQDYDQSFSYLSEGNALRRRALNYEISQDQELFRQIYALDQRQDAEQLKQIREAPDFMPVFILGMPRSGTSLVEQILACHSEVGAAGEFPYISNFSNSIIESQPELSKVEFGAFVEKYETGVRRLTNNEAFITDKFPLNFKYLNIIFLLFPHAKIIYVSRDPKAICWSNFKQYFSGTGLGYTYDMADTVTYYNMHRKLMDFWFEKFGNRIYRLDYEQLVVNQEEESRKLAEYVGLEWQDAMLSPQKNKRIVQTASLHQVQKAVYKGSSEQWKKFEPHLKDYFSRIEE
nr:sulfotransferase [uncultured Cohaesibacter sp.]